MANTNNNEFQDTIDLTADDGNDDDDDSPLPPAVTTTLAPRRISSTPITNGPSNSGERPFARAPPFGGQQPPHMLEVIDLSDDDVTPPRSTAAVAEVSYSVPSSPEVEFIRERPARANLSNQNRTGPNPPSRRLPSPPVPADLGFAMPLDFFRRGTRLIYDNLNPMGRPRAAVDDVLLDRIDGIQDRLFLGPQRDVAEPVLEIVGDDYEGLNLDYRQAGFAMDHRSSEPPQIVPDPYKGPVAAKEGHTRSWEEGSILVCPHCGDELTAGKGDVKVQVWVAKQCGHVYCGDCAANRVIAGRGSNKRDSRKAANRKTNDLRKCKVDGCEKLLTSKAVMFPIYL